MDSTKYTIYKTISQGLSLTAALLNIVIYIAIWSSEIDKVELLLTASKPAFLFSQMGCYICAVNVLFALITLCCITSKFKIWMRICRKFMLIQSTFNVCAITYFYFSYPKSVTVSVFGGSTELITSIRSLISTMDIIPLRGDVLSAFGKHVVFYVKIFGILQFISILSTLGNSYIFSKTLGINLENKPKKTPKISETTTVGIPSQSPVQNQIMSLRPIAVR